MHRPILLVLSLGILLPAPAPGQSAATTPRRPASPVRAAAETSPLAGYVFERHVRERWLHGRQAPGFTTFQTSGGRIHIDAVDDDAHGRRTFHLFVEGRRMDGPAALMVDSAGRVVSAVATAERRDGPYYTLERPNLFGERPLPSLHETRAWELVPAFHPPRLVRGASWTDTLDLAAERDGIHSTLRGVRRSTLLGDTIVDGRRLWIVHDSARVHYTERRVVRERTLDTLVVVDRDASGTIRGRYFYDTELRVYHVRDDTTELAGTAVLRYPDGRTFPTPARLERTRRLELLDPATREARARAREAEWRAEHAARPRPGPGAAPSSADRERDQAVEPGDTARVLRELLSSSGRPGRPLHTAELELLLPFMDDPGLAFAFGLRRDPLYQELQHHLLHRPPAVTADTTDWPCTPDACRLLARQWHTAREPRLRDLGLIAQMVLDPARWADTLVAHAASSTALLESALWLARGVGATWRASSKPPLPEPEADWRVWLAWMNGWSHDEASSEVDEIGPGSRIRFNSTHATALRFHEAWTGRDIVAELRKKLETAATDSARLVYGLILLELGECTGPTTPVSSRPTPSPPARLRTHADLPAASGTSDDEVVTTVSPRTAAASSPARLFNPSAAPASTSITTPTTRNASAYPSSAPPCEATSAPTSAAPTSRPTLVQSVRTPCVEPRSEGGASFSIT